MDPTQSSWKPSTVAVHAGAPTNEFGPVTPDITLSTTYRLTTPGEYGPYDYARSGNPSRAALETALAALEGGSGAGAFSSGLSAIDCVIRLQPPNSKVLLANDVYGGTWRLLDTVWRPFGYTPIPTNLADLDGVAALLDGVALIIVETPSNPLLTVLDIEAICRLAHAHGAKVAVDNTFATPYLQQPLALGADYVIHSTTKYLGGHSDVIGGAVIVRDDADVEKVHFFQMAVGAVQSPFDSFLVLRGIRTLGVRMERHCANALTVARHLADHPGVSQVLYPGLETHAGHAIAQRQMKAGGGMVSVRLAQGASGARQMAERAQLFTLAESLGAVESLIEVPASMTHLGSKGSPLEVPDDLVRLSVGIEDAQDLIADLDVALAF